VEESDSPRLEERLKAVDPELQGFAFEGAAMGLALLDVLTPWKRTRWRAFLCGLGEPHTYMVHVGFGWVLARLRRRVEPALGSLDPLLRWLAVDGYGFHEGYFHWQTCFIRHEVPRALTGYARRAYDQGLGRSLWFVAGADVTHVAEMIAAFPADRQADLWSGIGLACAYAGIVNRPGLEILHASAGAYKPQLAQGVAFAAKARKRAGNLESHTELPCEVLCGLSAAEAARITDAALDDLPGDDALPAFEAWRLRIQDRLAKGD
jgi:hypothetical protein